MLGPNGSGKSTLLSVILGSLTPSEGKISYQGVAEDSVYQQVSLAAPYQELLEELTLAETIDFHFRFKPLANGFTAKKVIDLLGFFKAENKLIKHFSSGMKQRTKLVLACCAATPLLILDEPTSNLDLEGIAWYIDLIQKTAGEKTVIIGSNQQHEYEFCEEYLKISDYK